MVLEDLAPGRAGLPAGPQNGDKHAARKWWADTIVPAIARVAPSNLPEPGRMEEIFERYEREVLPLSITHILCAEHIADLDVGQP